MQINTLVISNRIIVVSFKYFTDMDAALTRLGNWAQEPEFKSTKKPLGHSIHNSVLESMRAEKIKLSPPEKSIFKIYDKYGISKKPCIIIGCVRYDKEVILHELAHAAFTLFSPYRKKCQKIMRKLPALDRELINNNLEKDGYDKDVWEDEMHAYLLEDPKSLVSEIGMKNARDFRKRWLETSIELRKVFKQYMGQYVPLNILE